MEGTGLAARTLAAAPGTRTLARLALARGAIYPLLAVAPNAAGPATAGLGVLNGELRLDRAFVLPASGGNLPARLVTLWTALRSSPSGPTAAIYHLRFQFAQAGGGTQSVTETCAPSSWLAGEGVVVVAPLPAGARMDASPAISVTRETHSWWRPRIGTITLETAKELFFDPVYLPLSTTYGPGLAQPGGAATLTPPLAPGW